MTTIVVDLGCADFGSQNSLASLADTYKPTRMYGFDPHPLIVPPRITRVHGATTVLTRKAAWLYDGDVSYHENGTRSTVMNGGFRMVPCFDFSKWLGRRDEECIILKMDIEGAEYALLERMIEDGTDTKVKELLIEWHDGDHGLPDRLSCPVRQWWM